MKKNTPQKHGFIHDTATHKLVDGRKPEEAVRQAYEAELRDAYGYEYGQMDIEVPIQRGEKHNKKNRNERADIVIYRTVNSNARLQYKDVVGIVETKRPSVKDGIKQLASYMSATSCEWGVWTNGKRIEYLYRDPETSEIKKGFVFQIPKNGESFKDIGRISKDTLQPSNNLKVIFYRLLQTLYANTNISRKEKLGAEMTRLLFCKIWDENYNRDDVPEFRAGFNENPKKIAKRVKGLFAAVKNDLCEDGIFDKNEKITLDDKSIVYVVGQLERYSLLGTDKDVIGDAFEVFAESKLVGEKGEFFTPREIVKIAIKIVDPKPRQTICDPACGSGGFLIYALDHIWASMEKDRRWRGFSPEELKTEQKEIAEKYFYGIDKEIDLVKITKAYMAIIGDGKSKVVQENTLHEPCDYNPKATELFVEDENTLKQFDCVFTNPPFGSKIKVLAADAKFFDLGHKWIKQGSELQQTDTPKETEPQVLFVERCLQMLKPGGKLAIVLPETYFHAPTARYVLDYMCQHNVVAMVDLPHNTFRPYCNAKTLLIVLAKDQPQQEHITMAVCEEIGHNHTGRVIYRYDDVKKQFTDVVWNDSDDIIRELDAPSKENNQYVFTVPAAEIKNSIYVPRYYWKNTTEKIKKEAAKNNTQLVSIYGLIDAGIIESFQGHGSPASQYKGLGNIPYIRVKDIVNWSLYKNPTSAIPEMEYRRVKANGRDVLEKDILFIRRGSYRIGSVAMVSEFDTDVLLTKEIQTFRVAEEDNEYGLDAFYLLYLLSHPMTQKQLYNKIFIDTTLPNIGERWGELLLPIDKNVQQREKIKGSIGKSFHKKWMAQKDIQAVMDEFGVLTI